MIQWIKDLFKSKVEEEEKNTSIITKLEERYEEYGRTNGVIYVSKEELKDYYEHLFKVRTDEVKLNPYYIIYYFLDAKIEIDPAILRNEKLSQLGLLD